MTNSYRTHLRRSLFISRVWRETQSSHLLSHLSVHSSSSFSISSTTRGAVDHRRKRGCRVHIADPRHYLLWHDDRSAQKSPRPSARSARRHQCFSHLRLAEKHGQVQRRESTLRPPVDLIVPCSQTAPRPPPNPPGSRPSAAAMIRSWHLAPGYLG